MIVSLMEEEKFVVLDEVLEKKEFQELHKNFHSNLDFAYRSITGWKKVWAISDGQILAGPSFNYDQAPFNNFIDPLVSLFAALATQHFPKIFGKKGEDWDTFDVTPYIYPEGTKISWHNDGSFQCALIYYVHNMWNPDWGGELMIPATETLLPTKEDIEKDSNYKNHTLPGRYGLDSFLNRKGFGTYINPLPNRIVLTKSNVWHGINRIDKSAGNALRSSFVAFFSKSSKSGMVNSY